MLYASGSGVYGDLGDEEADEAPRPPGAGIDLRREQARGRSADRRRTATCSGCAAEPSDSGTSSGPTRPTASGYDFVRKLRADPARLEILGDGTQSKSYVHVDDVLAAVLLAGAWDGEPYAVFNVATGDYITVHEIAALAIECLDLDPGIGRAGLQRWQPRLERRRAGRPHRNGSHPRAGLAEPLRRAVGDAGVSPGDGGRCSLGTDRVSTTRRGVFLDRDGVLNAAVVRDGRPFPPDGPEHAVRLPRCRRRVLAGSPPRVSCSSS